MKTKKMDTAYRRVIVTLAVLLAALLVSIVLELTGQVAGWVAQMVIAFSFGRLCFLGGWSVGKSGGRWRV